MKIFEIIIASIGSVIFAIAVAWLASPSGLVTGGASGVGIVIKELSGGRIPIFVTSFALNVPLFIICAKQRGFSFIAKSTISFLILTIALSVFENVPSPIDIGDDLFMASLFYACLSGAGLGLVLRAGATSGGTDMLAAIIKLKRPSLPISSIIVIVDSVIIASGIFVFGLRYSLYAVFALVISSRVIDLIVSGTSSSKTVFVVSDFHQAIADRITTELRRGVTGIYGNGMYTKSEKTMLMTVISARELYSLRRIVGECDDKAFVIVWDTKQVLGEGFDKIFQSKDSLS